MVFQWLYILGFTIFWTNDVKIVVDQKGKGDFVAIQPAIDFALQQPFCSGLTWQVGHSEP